MTLIHFGTTYIVVKERFEDVSKAINIKFESFETKDQSNAKIVI